MHTTTRRLLLTGAMVAALPLTAALAQNSPAAQASTAATATVAQQLTIRDIYDRVEAAGYRDQREIEFDDGHYEVKATNAQGQRVKLEVNASTGAIERERVKR